MTYCNLFPSKSTEQIRSVFALRDYFVSNRQNQLRFAYKYYENDNHTSVILITEYDALRFIFDCYQFDYFSDGYRNLESIYENISKHFNYEVKPPESMANSLANTVLYFKHFDEAIYLFKLNAGNYPESYNVYNAMGDFYSTKGDKVNAIENYRKALSIKEVPAVRKKLENLKGK